MWGAYAWQFNTDRFENVTRANVKPLLSCDISHVIDLRDMLEIRDEEQRIIHLLSEEAVGSAGRLRTIVMHACESLVKSSYRLIARKGTIKSLGNESWKDQFENLSQKPVLVWLDLKKAPDKSQEALLNDFIDETCRDVNLSVLLTLEQGGAFDSSLFKQRSISLIEGISASKMHDDILLDLQSATQGPIDLLGYINGSLKELAEVIVRSVGKKEAHIAAIYQGDAPGSLVLRVRVSDINLLHTLRDNIMLGSFAAELCKIVKQPGQLARANSTALALALQGPASAPVKPQLPNDLTVQVDLTAFAKMYESSILRLDTLTPHQENKLGEALRLVDSRRNLHVKAPAGAGKTFVAMQLILQKLREGKTVLYVAVCSTAPPIPR